VTAKNRTAGANSTLIATLPAGTLVGDQVRNTQAGKASRCYVKKALGGNSFELTQPLVHVTGEIVFPLPAEVDTWANADTVQVVRALRVNVVQASATIFDFDGASANSLTLSNMTLADPGGVSIDNVVIGPGVNMTECNVERFRIGNGSVGLTEVMLNCLWQGGGDCQDIEAQYIGGGFVGVLWTFSACTLVFDGDVASEVTIQWQDGSTLVGFMWIGGGNGNLGIFQRNGQSSHQTGSYGGHALYGRAGITVSLSSRARAVMASGTWAAGWTAPTLVTGVTMNGGTVAQTHTNASPDVVTSGVTTSVANADSATGGNMMVWGGASISKAA
jgi:hypothetical protein